MYPRTAPVLLICLLASCSAERLQINLDKATVRYVDQETLFPENVGATSNGPQRQILELTLSSQVDLLDYLNSRGFQIQVRCSVTGNENGKAYNGYGIGPVPVAPATSRGIAKPYQYIAYTFIDLKADAVEYTNGKPESELDLRESKFDSLNCHVIGVDKAPILFPRSNDIVVTFATFQELVQQGHRK